MAVQQTYVPGYAHDCFVSYAWVDDQVLPYAGMQAGWVRTLFEHLKVVLTRRLRRSDWGDVWIDHRLDPTMPITPEVEKAVQGSATLLLVVSEGWLTSPRVPSRAQPLRRATPVEQWHGRAHCAGPHDPHRP
jgi:hypothetical protein